MDSIEVALIRSTDANTGITPDEPINRFQELHVLIGSAKPMNTRQRSKFNECIARVDEASAKHAYMLVRHPQTELSDEERRATYECLTGGKEYPA